MKNHTITEEALKHINDSIIYFIKNNPYETILKCYGEYLRDIKSSQSRGLSSLHSETMVSRMEETWPNIQHDYELWLVLK